MEFYLSKIFDFLLSPLNILFAIMLTQVFIILFFDSKKIVKNFSKFFFVSFLFFGYIPLSNFVLNKIEDYIDQSKYPINQLTGVVILGGDFYTGLISKERNDVTSSARMVKGLEIYKKNPKILIIFSGFSGRIQTENLSQSELARKFFLDHGVKKDNLIFEDKSKTTFENVTFSKDIINNYKGTWGLITSASHMPRSFLTFKKQGLILEPISVGYRTGTTKIFWLNFDITKGLSDWSNIFHEILGLAYYKVTNKI
jgi:uncharacterized SAM-binding protein YcdF (DUF218 family)